jgi:hypothetical protein
MRLMLLLLLLPVSVCAAEVRLAVGMDKEQVIALIKQNSGKDITGGLAVVGPKGEWPLSGFVWSLEDYHVIIQISGKAKIQALSYWRDKDFSQSKSHREKTEQRLSAITLNTEKKTVSLVPIKG